MSPQPILFRAIIRETLIPFQTASEILDSVPLGKHGLNALIEVHKAILSKQHPHWGQLREGPGVVRFGGKMVYSPPSPQEARALADEAMRWVAQQKASKSMDPEILAAEIMQRLVRAHPFKDGNGRASRAVGAWILCRSRYHLILDPRLYCKLNVDRYYQALGAPAVDLTKSPSGPWYDYCSGMFLQCFRSPGPIRIASNLVG